MISPLDRFLIASSVGVKLLITTPKYEGLTNTAFAVPVYSTPALVTTTV
jgi:hypothetical protein